MPESFSVCLTIAEQELRLAKTLLQAEISDYPTPISGCDAQFNHLLAERQKVTAALEALGQVPFVPTPRQPSPSARVESR